MAVEIIKIFTPIENVRVDSFKESGFYRDTEGKVTWVDASAGNVVYQPVRQSQIDFINDQMSKTDAVQPRSALTIQSIRALRNVGFTTEQIVRLYESGADISMAPAGREGE
jgi:hypothetical protein